MFSICSLVSVFSLSLLKCHLTNIFFSLSVFTFSFKTKTNLAKTPTASDSWHPACLAAPTFEVQIILADCWKLSWLKEQLVFLLLSLILFFLTLFSLLIIKVIYVYCGKKFGESSLESKNNKSLLELAHKNFFLCEAFSFTINIQFQLQQFPACMTLGFFFFLSLLPHMLEMITKTWFKKKWAKDINDNSPKDIKVAIKSMKIYFHL